MVATVTHASTIMILSLLLFVLPLSPIIDAKGDRNVQRFVTIDVPKINVKNTTDTTNVSSSTTSSPATEGGTTMTTATTTITLETTVPTTSTAASSTVSSTVSTATTENSTPSLTSTIPASPVEPTNAPIDIDPPFPSLMEGRSAKLIPRGYFCQCDLMINTCDVNCCCDIDCNETILKAFHCDEEQLNRNEYHHDAGLQSCRVQGGLFCLVEPIHEEGDDRFYDPKRLPAATKYKWKDVFAIGSGPDDVHVDHYRVGDVMNFFNETNETVQSFDLPYSLTDSACQVSQPVRFLRNSNNLCRRTVEELTMFNRAFLEHHRAARFFRTPKKSTVMEHYCAEGTDCINATLSVCHAIGDAAGWNCTQNFNATSNATVDGLLELLEDDGIAATGTCDRLEINFYHNFTQLLAVRATLFCQPDTPDTWDDTFVWQRVAVNFPVATSGKRNSSMRTVSGNLGYLIGKPLIISHLDAAPNGTLPNGGAESGAPSGSSPNAMLAYFTNGSRLADESFRLRLPISKANRCTLTEQSYQTINFGVDSWHRCNFVPVGTWNVSTNATTTTTATQNYTQLCRDLQDGLYKHLLYGVRKSTELSYDQLNLFLSKYANPVNRTADWIRMRSVNVIPEAQPGGSDSDSGVAIAVDGHDYFTCSNMLINVDYRFYYAHETVRDVRHQAILHAGEVVFGPRVNLRFRRDEEVRVPIFVQVQFFDLTSSTGNGNAATKAGALLGLFCALLLHITRSRTF